MNLWNGAVGTWSTTSRKTASTANGYTLAGNGEEEWYINANYGPTSDIKPWTVTDGVLTLTAERAAPSLQTLINGYKYTSGALNTSASFAQTYGYFEMRAKLPAGQGAWPAFWLLPADGGWPPELDVVEMLGNDPTKIYASAHSGLGGRHTSTTAGVTVANTSTDFHTYAVDWQEDKITWYFDGKAIYSMATPADMHKPMYMVVNLAVGGSWPGSPNASTPFPAHMDIDYIRAYTSNPATSGAPIEQPSYTPGGLVALEDGRFVSLQRSFASGGHDLVVSVSETGKTGVAVEKVVATDTYTHGLGVQLGASDLIALSGGGFAVAYGAFAVGAQGASNTINLQIYGADGQKLVNIVEDISTVASKGTLSSTPDLFAVSGGGVGLISDYYAPQHGWKLQIFNAATGAEQAGLVFSDRPTSALDLGGPIVLGFDCVGGPYQQVIDHFGVTIEAYGAVNVLTGGDGYAILRGGDGADKLVAGAGGALLVGNGGFDTLVGGSGQDTFVLKLDGGVDRILNFDWKGGDKIQIVDAGGGALDVSAGVLVWDQGAHTLGWSADGQSPAVVVAYLDSVGDVSVDNFMTDFHPKSVLVINPAHESQLASLDWGVPVAPIDPSYGYWGGGGNDYDW